MSNEMSTEASDDPQMQKVSVLVNLYDGSKYRGCVHLKQHQRVQDLLNDERHFIPIDLLEGSGETVIVAKRFVISIKELKSSGS